MSNINDSKIVTDNDVIMIEEEKASGERPNGIFSAGNEAVATVNNELDIKEENSADNNRKRRVFVGNLSYRTPWQILKDHMRQAGSVIRAEVFSDSLGRSAGCGVVEFETEEMAQMAIAKLNDSVLEGRPIFVREDRENSSLRHNTPFQRSERRKIVIWNLPVSAKWQDLKDLFSKYGTVIRADVKKTHDERVTKMGTILFSKEAEAEAAIAAMNGREFEGNILHIRMDRFV
ncbi:hypothetical protein GpartN1_g3103.t1 [Galdieria partita]|uniref:RRM domain-containing protein n=1 Tax=Galdieria partita TaxID=83374 RepID=A0A9C7PWT7_9RHOD|nr:hypothetical protein GpartN1_g3103.t1 [Galdieria partita]